MGRSKLCVTPVIVIFLLLFGLMNSSQAAWVVMDSWGDVFNEPGAFGTIYGEDASGNPINQDLGPAVPDPDTDPMSPNGSVILYDSAGSPLINSTRMNVLTQSPNGNDLEINMWGSDYFNDRPDPGLLYNGEMNLEAMGGSNGMYKFSIGSDFGRTGAVDVAVNINELLLPMDMGMAAGYMVEIFDSNMNEVFNTISGEVVNGQKEDIISLNFYESYSLWVGFDMVSSATFQVWEGVVLGDPTMPLFNDLAVIVSMSVDESPVPVPGSLWLFTSGLIGFVGLKKRKR